MTTSSSRGAALATGESDGSGVVAQLYAGDAPYYSDLVGVTLSDGVLSPLYTGNPANRAQPLAWVTP